MFIRTSGAIGNGLYLLTAGHTCHYILAHQDRLTIFDPGLSAHAPVLIKRIAELDLDPTKIDRILLTHLHADRLGALPHIRTVAPQAKLCGTSAMQNRLKNTQFVKELFETDRQLTLMFPNQDSSPGDFEQFATSLRIDSPLVDSDLIKMGDEIGIRVVSFPGHTDESLAFYILPHRFLIADEALGYYNGRNLAAPGCDRSLTQNRSSLEKLNSLDVAGLCFPSGGVLTGQLVRKHLSGLIQNIDDLQSECQRAHAQGLSDELILNSIRDSFFSPEESDPISEYNQQCTLRAVWAQILAIRK